MSKRVRVAGIIKLKDWYAFMHRKNVIKRKDYQEYYTFPGGGVEEGETLEEAIVREIKEEFGITIKPIKKLYEMESKKFDQKEIFFLCEYIEGKFGTGDGPEFNNDPKYKDLSPEQLPKTENLVDTIKRVIEYWNSDIKPELEQGKHIIIAAHGNSLRGLIKNLDNLSDEEIIKTEVQTGNPICYELDDNLKPIRHYYVKDM